MSRERQAGAAAADLGVWMLNVPALGGRRMMESARAALGSSGRRPLLIAVTVLTSLADADLRELGWSPDAGTQAERLAQLAAASGLDGIVCSAQEAPRMRQVLAPHFRLVTPGIRPAGSAADDQARINQEALASVEA